MPSRKIHPRAQWSGLMSKATWAMKKPYADAMGYHPHPAQLEFHADTHRFKVPCCGRRFGKTVLCSFEACFCALMGGWVMCVAPTYNLANKVWLEALMMLKRSPFASLISDVISQEGKQAIRLTTGGIIVAKSSENPKSLLGDGWDLCIFDEAAMEPSGEPWKKAIRPALMDRKGAAIFPSTPMGDNWYKDIYDLGQSKNTINWWSKSFPSSENPIMTDDEIQDYITSCGIPKDLVSQEIYAQFMGSGGAVFTNYHEVSDAVWQDMPNQDHIYCAGLDIGKIHDYTVLAIWDCSINSLANLLRINLVPYPELEREVERALLLWGGRSGCPVLVDITRESGTADRLRETCWFCNVVGFSFSNDSKSKIMSQLRLAFEDKTAHILNQDTELGVAAYKEFGAYRYERMSSGIVRMSAPQGKHDDIVTAVALAYECCIRYVGITSTVTTDPQSKPITEIAGTYSFDEGVPRNVAVGTIPARIVNFMNSR